MATPPASTGKPAAAAPAPIYQNIDRPELAETFADHLRQVIFDGNTLRIEFGVTRLDEAKPNAAPSGRRYPSCRLVLTSSAAVELMNHMQRIATGLVQAGVLKAEPAAGARPVEAAPPKAKN